ncbi:hypothetical protein C2E23DRAFT_853642 [Lenzites betulinus]|nr:hypothetical protein C2E23DRAFT_853642 [Lenzites betulinus]
MHVCYYYLVTNYFRPQNLSLGLWSTNLYPSVAGLTMAVSQSFFARRVWLLEPRYRPVVVLSCILSLAELGIFITGTVMEFITENPEFRMFLRLTPIAFCLAMASDLILTTLLIHILRRKRTGFSTATDNIVSVLMMYSVNTGLLNGVFDLLTTVLAFVRPHNTGIWGLFAIAGAKLYAITLLAALHSRSTFRAQYPTGDREASDCVFGACYSPTTETAHSDIRSLRRGRTIHEHQMSTIDGCDIIEIKAISPLPHAYTDAASVGLGRKQNRELVLPL